MPIDKNEITKEMIAKAKRPKRIWLNWKILNWIQMFYRRSLVAVYMRLCLQ